MSKLAEKVILVTGAAGGQGLATARLLHDHGAQVVATDIRVDTPEWQDPHDSQPWPHLQLDVANEHDWDRAVKFTATTFGHLDGLVNNAGLFHTESLAEFDQAQAQRIIAVNQIGPILGMRACLPLLSETRGAIVNISSTAALRGFPGRISYTSSKWALRGISRAAATELGPHGIRVNCILPGLIDTDMASINTPDFNATIVSHLPIPRLGRADEVANAALFLLSDAASYITGAELVVDGGGTA